MSHLSGSILSNSTSTRSTASSSRVPPPSPSPPPPDPLAPLVPSSPSPATLAQAPSPRVPGPGPNLDPPLPAGVAPDGFGSAFDTLTEPVWDTVKSDAGRIVSNLMLVVFPNPNGEDRGKALRDWDLWALSSSSCFLGSFFRAKKSQVFAVAFAVLAAGAVILTLNVLLLGGHIIFFQSISLLGYCLFPLDIGALICMVNDIVMVKVVVATITLPWSSWAAYPFTSTAVVHGRKALALYSVFLMYISVGFLIGAIT